MKETLLKLMAENPNDYIVIASRWMSDFKYSMPFTLEKNVKEKYYKYLNQLDINWNIGIYQLNNTSLKRFLEE